MALKKFIATALVGGAALLGGLEAKADTINLNGATNVYFGPFSGDATGTVDRATEYMLDISAGAGGSVTEGTSGWYNAGEPTGDIVFTPSNGYHLASVTTNGVYAGNDLTNNFTMSGPLDVAASFDLNTYQFVFRDEKRGVNVTNTVTHGSNVATNFPLYFEDPQNSGIRYRAETVTGTGVNVSTNAP